MQIAGRNLLAPASRLFRLKTIAIPVLIILGIASAIITLFHFEDQSVQLINKVIVTNGKTFGVTDILELTYLPWSNDPECSDLTVQFIRNGSHPPMALASYGGSGNTWIRGLIERLTGYFTGSVPFIDTALYMKGNIYKLQ